jgi:hypothetical protein
MLDYKGDHLQIGGTSNYLKQECGSALELAGGNCSEALERYRISQN